MNVIAEKNENNMLPTMIESCTGRGLPGRGCGRLLEFTPLDVFKGTYTSWEDTETYYYIVCPKCGQKTEVFYSQMTSDFKHLIP